MKTEQRTKQQIKALEEIAVQVKMALTNDETPEGVKDCIKTIIINAATESSALITDINDSVLLSDALPGIIENLDFDYGRGVLHSIHAIVQYDTTAFKDFYEQRLDEKIEQQSEQIGMDKIRLTPAQAVELSESIITQTTGIFSADESDDEAKQALLILLSAIVYEDDMMKRENILIDVSKAVFGYSFACDAAENQFIGNGFEAFSNGKWNVQIEEIAAEQQTSENPKIENEDSESSEKSPDNLDIDLLAAQLSEVLNNPKMPTKLYNLMTDELCENHADTTSPDYIKANLLNNERLQNA